MSIVTTREQRRQLARDNAKLPATLELVPRHAWPEAYHRSTEILRVWRSRHFLVQEYEADPPAIARLSVLRTSLDPATGRWHDGITWDELQGLKAQCGYATAWAVEVFPDAREVVNVANLRHLWVLPEAPAFAWRRTA